MRSREVEKGEVRKVFLITVKLPETDKPLLFRVIEYTLADGHVRFVDSKTGLMKSFPSDICYIDEVRP